MKNVDTKYWLACSGGVDSVVLAHLLHQKKIDFGILHCNFQLRGEDSNQDEIFVRNLAKKLNVSIRVKVFDTNAYGKKNKINTQLAARELRYNWFDEIIKDENGIVLIAHHYDDQLETFFLQLRRGASVRGLSGMPQYKNGYLRPLLKYTKEELVVLAIKYQWEWREDKSNESNDYSRNWYRHEVLPLLKEFKFPLNEVIPLVNNFQKVLHYFDNTFVKDKISIQEWLTFPIWYQQHILNHHNLGEFPVKEINKLTESSKGKFIGNDVSQIWNEGEVLVFIKLRKDENHLELIIEKLKNTDITFEHDYLYLDASKINGKLSFRKWGDGDYFQPIGMKGAKKISKFLRDRKVATHLKDEIYILKDDSNEILGVFGFNISEKVKITSDTKEVFKVGLLHITK